MQELVLATARALATSRYAIALTGAGISTESGIPDFRGPKGIWTRDPAAERRAYQSYEQFLTDPETWWRERLKAPALLGDLSAAQPNPGHLALAQLEEMGFMKTVITQNVDGLHDKAGSHSVIEYHGSMLKLRCLSCNSRFPSHTVDLAALAEKGMLPPMCPACDGPLKPDSVAFGEPIPEDVVRRSREEIARTDFLLICGTSAVVYPFADLPRIARRRARRIGPDSGESSVTIVEINAEPTSLTTDGVSDYIIAGKTGVVLPSLVAAFRNVVMG